MLSSTVVNTGAEGAVGLDEVSDEFGDRPFVRCGSGGQVGASVEDAGHFVRCATEHGQHVGGGLLAQVFGVGGVERAEPFELHRQCPAGG